MGLSLLALACLVGAAFAGPLLKESSQCSTHCSDSPNRKFDYEVGKTYTYTYRGENLVSAAGKSKQKATIEGLAVIHVKDRCEMVLQLKNLRIQQKQSQEEIQELIRRLETPVPFAYDDGKVEHVCPSHEEDSQSLNIKKGLISTLINTMSKLDTPQEVKEFDSLGNCVTKYSVKYAHGLEITKEKSLKSCTNRHSSVTALITSPYENPDSKVHTLPIFPEEKLMCKQYVDDKIIKKVDCEEYAKIKPLKQRESVIQFEGHVYLTLLSVATSGRVPSSRKHSPQSILYNLEEQKDTKSMEKESEMLLKEMCSKNQHVMDISVSKDFIELVSLVKSLPYSSLSRFHSSLKNGRICSSKKVLDLFVDTLPMAGSDAAIKLMVELLENKEISGLKAKFWPATLALITHPTRETVSEVLPLLKGKPSSVVLLGVSAMVHRFCQIENCDQESAIHQIVSSLNQHLGQGCNSESESEMYAALKAFGNMGYHGEAESNILACARNSDKPTRLRLAAIDAFRRINKARPDELLNIYSDMQENYELRIAALSSVMKRANVRQLRIIKRTAEHETDNQVSGYFSTLQRNMQKTSSPLKKGVRNSLKQVEINPPKVNYWENSKNIEFSTFSESFNVGGSVESDIVHHPESKIPRSVTTRFDADVLNHNINFFEIGLRAEGLESIVKNLIGLKDKIPKMSARPSWNLLSTDTLFSGSEVEASAFIRTMDTEIFDLSASDLSGIGEMIKIADLMSKLSSGKSTDFSHSFLFMNSRLVLPSVTGRSYSFGVTGSSTIGLSASTKLDFMRFPRNTDITAHFQPSVNLEVSTTVGIQSSKHRPDMKLTSRLHLESDLEAEFKIKDGHVALAKLSLPSENVVLAKVSSDIVEVDAYHHEKPMYEKMQKKIDYCFDKLHKPLGISVCGVLEVPKPFVSKSFPFIHGVGSMEFSIKKSDHEMEGYEISLERPRHSDPVKKYRASFNTPGSRISRQFSAELDVRQRGRDHKEYSLELKSPFKSAGGRGSYTYRPDLVEGSFELRGNSYSYLSANASAQISSSSSKKIIKPSLSVTIGNSDPLQVGGSITVGKGRKQLISIDIKTNTPTRKPASIKGTILKEGSISLSKKAEWKVSSELTVEGIMFDTKMRSTVEKKSKQAQTISANFETDYKFRSQKHTIKFSGTSQLSGSSKISTNALFQSSQFPAANLSLKWEMQGKHKQSLRNDLTVRYGRDPERTYITVKQNSHVPEDGPGQCSIVVKAPQFNIDSELTVKHQIISGHTPKIQLEADLCYKDDKHIKGLLHFNHESIKPLKASTRAEIEYPEGKLSYSDEVEETITNKFVGKSRIQWKENKQVELKYNYQILSDENMHHHELETSLTFPSKHSPIQSKTSFKMNHESAVIEGSMTLRQNSQYSAHAHLNKRGPSHIKFQSPKLEGNVKLISEDGKRTLDLDIRVKGSSSRRITASTSAEWRQKKSFSADMSWDADRRPDKKVSLASEFEMSRDRYSASAKFQVTDLINISLSESGKKSFLGSCEGSLDASVRNYQPIRVDFRHEYSGEKVKCEVKFSQNHAEKVELTFEGSASDSRNGRDMYTKTCVKSLDNSFESKEFELKLQQQKSGSSTGLKNYMRLKRSSSKTYMIDVSSDYHSRGIEIKIQVQTPHRRFFKQSIDMSVQKSENSVSCSLTIDCLDNKIISITHDITMKKHEMITTLALRSPFDIVRDMKVHLAVDNHRSKKSMLSYLDINSARIGDISARMTKNGNDMEAECQIKLSPLPQVPVQALRVSCKRSRNSLSLSGEVQLQGDKKMSASSEFSSDRSGFAMTCSLSTPYRKFQSLSTSCKLSGNVAELSASIQYQDGKRLSMESQVTKERSGLSATASLTTPYRKLKDAKAHIELVNLYNKKSLLAFVDANGERKGDVEVNYSSSSSGIEIQSRMKTVRSKEVSAHAKYEKKGQSMSVSANIKKGSRLLSSRSIRSNAEEDKLETTLLDLQISKEVSGNSKKYNVKMSGPMTPLSLTVLTSRTESNALNVEMNACQESQERPCYSLKTTHKALRNSEGYNHYQRISVETEKSSSNAKSEKLGSLNVILTTSDHDYKSKVTVQYKGKDVGYEVRLHKREHEDDHCSVDAYIFLPSKTSRLRASILHSTDHLLLEIEAVPNSDNSQRKLGFEVKKEHNRQKNEISGYIKLSHPKSEKPILLVGNVQKEGRYPSRGKLELQYSSQSGSRALPKSLTLEAKCELQRSSSGKKYISYKLYNADKSLDVSFELQKQSSRQEDTYGYEWTYKHQSSYKKGGVSIKLSQKKNGRPQSIDISYYTPSVSLEVQGRSAQAPSDMSIALLSSGQVVKEITIKTTEHCAEMKIQRSGPFFESSICVNKQVGSALKFVSMEAYYRRHKSLDVSIGVEPENPAYIDINMEWKKDDLCQALSEVTGLSYLIHDRTLQELEHEMKQKWSHFKTNIIRPAYRDLVNWFKQMRDHHSKNMKQLLQHHHQLLKSCSEKVKALCQHLSELSSALFPWDYIRHQVIQPVAQAIRCLLDTYLQLTLKHIPDVLRIVVDATKEQLKQCLKKFCVTGTFCHDLQRTYERHGYKEARKLVYQKMKQSKQNLQRQISRWNPIPDIMETVRSAVHYFRETVDTLFDNFFGKRIISKITDFFKRQEQKVRQRLISLIDRVIQKINDIIHLAEKDEDFRTVRTLLQNAERKAKKTWQSRERLVKQEWEPLKKSMMNKSKEFIHERIDIKQFDPKRGSIKIRVRHPLRPRHIQVVKNALTAASHKLQQSVSI